jgi:hypothetical protein
VRRRFYQPADGLSIRHRGQQIGGIGRSDLTVDDPWVCTQELSE